MDRYELGHEITDLLNSSSEPIEDIKYLVKILEQSSNMYFDRESIQVHNDLRKIELGVIG